uniref:THD domain-containing protein n=1 Tax=Leptobrachium leishanense TaxID=445787 RepID=A0A8C5M4N0_9ANUR
MSHVFGVNGPVAFARGLWGGTGSWLGIIVCIIVLICQSVHLGNLQRELSEIQKSKEDNGLEVSDKNRPFVQCPRQKREVLGRRNRRHNALAVYLYSDSHIFYTDLSVSESNDITGVSWKVSLHEGKAFELKGEKAKVKHSGIYYIYSQVLYTDTTFTMGQLVTRQAEGDTGMGDTLLRCMQSMPPDKNVSYNTCYSAGVFRLQKGDVISIIIPRHNASVAPEGYSTFLGLVKI